MKYNYILCATFATWLTAQPAAAYQFSPAMIRATLKGQLTFTPNNGGQAFSCNVVVEIRTRGKLTKTGARQSPQLEYIYFKNKSGVCANTIFGQPFPWTVDITNISGGVVFGGSWGSITGSCPNTITPFTDNASGVFTFGPGCISGALVSSPVVTIIP